MPPRVKKAPPKTEEVVYPDLNAKWFLGDDSMNAEWARTVLGWEEEPEPGAFGKDYLLTDANGKKVRCRNNTKNRHYDHGWGTTLAQDILNKRWADSRWKKGRTPNGETVILGRYGQVLSAQHRLIALVLADQIRNGKDKEGRWDDIWGKGVPVTIEGLVVFGVDESEETTRTLDNVKPRTLTDVIFARPDVFGKKVTQGDKQVLARMLDYAVKTLWSRLGLKRDAFSPVRTHAEGMEFISAHPRIIDAVRHIWEEDQPADVPDTEHAGEYKKVKPISKLLSPGTAAALLYLMAASESDRSEYRYGKKAGTEKALDFSLWDVATEFWTLVGSGLDFHALRYALGELKSGDTKGSFDDQCAVVVKAWNLFRAGEKIELKDVRLLRRQNDDGVWARLESLPSLGGIDAIEDDPRARPRGKADDRQEAPALSGGGAAAESEPEEEEVDYEEGTDGAPAGAGGTIEDGEEVPSLDEVAARARAERIRRAAEVEARLTEANK